MSAASPERLVLSSADDLAAVQRLRAECDAIVAGAGTVRADDPSFATRTEEGFAIRERLGKPPHPAKVALTRTGDIPEHGRFFRDGDGPRIVFLGASASQARETALRAHAETVRAEGDGVTARFVASTLAERGYGRVLVEGGAEVAERFIEEGCVDAMRVAIAPVILGDGGGTRFLGTAFAPARRAISLRSVEDVGGTAVLWFDFKDI